MRVKHIMETIEAPAVLLALVNDAAGARRGRKQTVDLEDLRNELRGLQDELQEIIENAGEEDLTADELADVEEIEGKIKNLETKIRGREIIARSTQQRAGRGTRAPRDGSTAAAGTADPAEGAQPRRGETVPAQPRNEREAKTFGFTNFGDFASAVGRGYKGIEEANNRLQNTATTYGAESAGGDGGWLVPPEFSEQIWTKVQGEDSLLSRCAPFVTSRNSLMIPKNEDTPWNNASGIEVFWQGEGTQGTESKAKFEMTQAYLNKLFALVKVTEELLEDAAGLDSYLRYWVPVKMIARINTAIISGTGAGQPKGILNAGSSLITVSKEVSQDASTIILPNINHMWNRLYAPLRQNAVWLINQEVEPMLEGMAFVPSATAPGAALNAMTAYTPVYLPAGGIADAPFGRLKGRPVVPVQACKQLGTLGDIILTDLMQYMALRKAQNGEIRVDTSIHLHFDQAIDTYRFIFRVTGEPLWNTSITPENGSNTYSWAVALETRS